MAACLPSRHGSSSPAGGAIPSLPLPVTPRNTARRASPPRKRRHAPVRPRSGSLPPAPGPAVWRNHRPPSRRGGRYGIACVCGTAGRNPPPPSATGRRTRCWSWRRRLRICRYRPRWGGGARREGGRKAPGCHVAWRLGPAPPAIGLARPPLFPVLGCFLRFGVCLGFFFFLTISCR